jgi:hypothetical protein
VPVWSTLIDLTHIRIHYLAKLKLMATDLLVHLCKVGD